MVLYGAGGLGYYAYAKFKNKFDIIAYADSEKDKQSLTVHGLPVYPPDALKQIDCDVIEICSSSAEIIKHILVSEYMINENKISTVFIEQSNAARENTLLLISKTINNEKIAGNVAELGVYCGNFAKEINRYFSDCTLYLFDTFEGFPRQDELYDIEKGFSSYKASYMKTTNVDEILNVMPYPKSCIVKQGYFPDTIEGLEDSFVFVSLDPDLYKPVLEGLRYFYPRLQNGGFVMIHDYFNPFFLGVREAVKDYEIEIGYCLPKIPVGDLMSIVLQKITD